MCPVLAPERRTLQAQLLDTATADFYALTETSWRPDERLDLTHRLLPWQEASAAADLGGAYAACVDGPVRGGTPRVLVGLATSEPLRSGTPLADHLRRHGDLVTDLLGAAFVLDAFTRSDAWRGRPVATLQPAFDPLPFVDDLLRDTHGLLIWHHQLEALFGLFVRSAGGPVRLRAGINARRADVFERARPFVFASGVTVEDVIEERMVFGSVARANLHGARLLLEAQAPPTRA